MRPRHAKTSVNFTQDLVLTHADPLKDPDVDIDSVRILVKTLCSEWSGGWSCTDEAEEVCEDEIQASMRSYRSGGGE